MYYIGSELLAQKDFSYLLTVVKEFNSRQVYDKDVCPAPPSGWDRSPDMVVGMARG